MQRFYGVISSGSWEKLSETAKRVMRENAATLIGQASERREPFSAAAMREIAAPTLLLNRALSPPFFHVMAEAMLRHIKDVRRVVIDGAGHTMNVQQPAAFDAAVLKFLAAH